MAKDEPGTEAPADEAGLDPASIGAPEAPKSRKKLIIIGAAVTAVLAAGGGGAFFFLSKGKHAAKAAPEAAAAAEAEPTEAAPAAEPAAPAEGEGDHAAAKNSNYVAIQPAFVVNLSDDEAMRFLSVEIELATSDSHAADAVKLHMPLIRNNLLLLMGQKRYHELDKREGKEALRAEMLAEVRKVLKEQADVDGIEGLYFTSFVMQ